MTAPEPAHGDAALGAEYDVLLLDLDGTVYRGAEAIPGVGEALAACRARNLFVTNNASRSPEDVAAHLTRLGVPADADAVVTSAQAGARLVAGMVPPGAPVLVVGADALADEAAARGLRPVRRYEPGIAAVVQGFSRDVAWADLAEAALALRAGARWVATNVDSTLPDERGLLPGNGSLVAALATATGLRPEVAGKPARPIMDDAVRRSGARRPLVVGDRLDTDIAGACAAGLDSLLVLTGVSTAAEVIRAAPTERPRYISASLAALGEPAERSRVAAADGWTASIDGRVLRLSAPGHVAASAAGPPDPSGPAAMAGLRAAAAAAWPSGFDGRLAGTDPVSDALAARWNG